MARKILAPRLCCRAPEPVKFPTPLHLRLHCPVFPISGSFQYGALPPSTGLGALCTVWSMWSTTESHRKMTVRERLIVRTRHAHGCMHATERGEVNVVKERLPSEVYCTWRVSAGSTAAASKCLLITRKIMIPPTDRRDPLDGPPYCEKNVCPLTAGTHLTGHRISQKKRPPAVSSDPPKVPPYYAQKNEYSPC